MTRTRTGLRILMIAAENDGLAGGKVGGIGDVVRDVPPALADLSCTVTVVVPCYGFLHLQPGSRRVASVTFKFAGYDHELEVFEVPGRRPHHDVTQLVIHHPDFESFDAANGIHRIYINDPPDTPFKSDARKYALFCMAVAEGVRSGVFGGIDVLHLHDWHAAFLLILREYHSDYRSLQDLPVAFTIHNLAYQGIRPFRGSHSSLETWYPGMKYGPVRLADPRYVDCLNPMAVGIRLSNTVHTVSPSYAEEIVQPSDQDVRGFYGGEGLEGDLSAVRKDGRLFGILNGCEYPPDRIIPKYEFPQLVKLFRSSVLSWAGAQQHLSTSHFVAHTRLAELGSRAARPGFIAVSVSRVNDQKMRLLVEHGQFFATGLQGILDALGKDSLYVMLGTGDPHYEQFFTSMSSRFENFIFLNGYSEECAKALYANGDLFLMPSSYEPCGISQMLAMRDGQPCLVHGVGGLKDTVRDGENGFSFEGDTIPEQVDNMVRTLLRAVEIKRKSPDTWRKLCRKASEARFLWRDTVTQYMEKLYNGTLMDADAR